MGTSKNWCDVSELGVLRAALLCVNSSPGHGCHNHSPGVWDKAEHGGAWACPAGHSFLRQQIPSEMGVKVCIGGLSSISGHRGKYKLFKAVRVPALWFNSWRKSLQDTGKSRAEVPALHH